MSAGRLSWGHPMGGASRSPSEGPERPLSERHVADRCPLSADLTRHRRKGTGHSGSSVLTGLGQVSGARYRTLVIRIPLIAPAETAEVGTGEGRAQCVIAAHLTLSACSMRVNPAVPSSPLRVQVFRRLSLCLLSFQSATLRLKFGTSQGETAVPGHDFRDACERPSHTHGYAYALHLRAIWLSFQTQSKGGARWQIVNFCSTP